MMGGPVNIQALVSGGLFVLCVPLFLICASVAWAFNDPGVYQRGFQKYQVSAFSGIEEEDLQEVGAGLRDYFNSLEEPLDIRARVCLGGGSSASEAAPRSAEDPRFRCEDRALFNDREVHHMRDVKRLVWGVYAIAVLTGLYLAGCAAWALTSGEGNALRRLARRCVWGGGITIGVIVLFGAFALTGFAALFTLFHQVSFTNDLWQLDPRTDYLLILFPLGFWFDATLTVALRAAAGALAMMVAGGGYLVYRRRADSPR